MKKFKKLLSQSLVAYVLFPWLFFSIYQLYISAPRFESQSKVIVKQPDAISTMDPSMALLTGLGVNTGNTDIQLVKLFIESVDMVEHLNETLQLLDHYDSSELSFLSKLYSIDNQDDLYVIYSQYISVETDELSGAIIIQVQAYDSVYAQRLNREIIAYSEKFINSIGHQLAKAQITFIDNEHQRTEEKLHKAKSELLSFQRKYGLLDPEAEGMAFQAIAYGLETSLAAEAVELKALQSVMSDSSLLVSAKKAEIKALKEQINIERKRLSQDQFSESNVLSRILSEYSDLKINLELSLKAYVSSQISLEKSRVEAYRQLKHLVIIESPTKPVSNKYPETAYNIFLALSVLMMMYLIIRIIISTIKELS
jgi:capsular polysaccharide transport system permease protein